MSHQCPFPVCSTDNRFSYRTGSFPGFTLCLALVAALSGYAGLSHALPVSFVQQNLSDLNQALAPGHTLSASTMHRCMATSSVSS